MVHIFWGALEGQFGLKPASNKDLEGQNLSEPFGPTYLVTLAVGTGLKYLANTRCYRLSKMSVVDTETHTHVV